MRAEPRFEVFVGGLPVGPDDGRFADGTAFSSEIVDVKRFSNEMNFAFGF